MSNIVSSITNIQGQLFHKPTSFQQVFGFMENFLKALVLIVKLCKSLLDSK